MGVPTPTCRGGGVAGAACFSETRHLSHGTRNPFCYGPPAQGETEVSYAEGLGVKRVDITEHDKQLDGMAARLRPIP